MNTSAKLSTVLTFTALIISGLDLMSIGAAEASLLSIPRQEQNPGSPFAKAESPGSIWDLGLDQLQDDKSKRFVRDVAADVAQDKSFNWEELSAMDDCFVSYEPGFDGSSKNNKNSKKGKKIT